MAKTLILTGWKYGDYAVAAALALRHFKVADILGMSRRRLPEYLEEVSGYAEIVILGVSLAGDAERLAKALERLRKAKVKVTWISGFDFPEWMGDDIRSRLESYISPSGSISVAVAEYYKLNHGEFAVYGDEGQPVGKAYMEFMRAAEYCYRNYQDEQAYPRVIRHMEAMDAEGRWSESERRMVEHYRRYGHRELVGKSEAIQKLQGSINLIAPHEHTRVLILGESGTGKETVATQIHFKSPRKDEPFLAFNCSSVTPNLLESRFLGYEKGAFTGANEAKAGVFETANGGTLFLDEIGELPLEAQGLLLRVLEEGRFQRLGGNAREVEVDVRVIAATNRDLAAMVRDGKFRRDLYHRLCVVQLRVPPLREHKEDIPLIAYAYRDRNHMGGWLAPAQVEALQTYDFPGNVRELNNLLERAYVLNIDDYGELIRQHRELNAALVPQDMVEVPDDLEEAIRLHVKRVCEKYSHNITNAAKAMKVSRNTVRKYLE
ncbi:MAG: sigma 54-interacting transcriptional regulator [Victivallales bacterium]|nr:sigma 54-interacting transcriptional regulator [Victivallales bacterium]